MRGRFSVLCAAAALAVALGACGDDDEDNGDGGEAAEPATLSITLSQEGEEEFSFSLPESVPAGLVRIEFTSEAGGDHGAQLVRYDGDRTAEEVAAAGEAWGGEGGALPSWFHIVGGVGSAERGATTSVTQQLEPGNYVAIDIESNAADSFRVTEGEAAGELPESTGRIDMQDYDFETEGLRAGRNTVLIDNAGEQPHLVSASPLREGATIDDVRRFLEEEEGEPPIEDEGGLTTAILDGGLQQVAELELQEGRYALICFVPNREGGPPHFQRGMIAEAEVR